MFYLDQATGKRYTLGTPFSYGGQNYTAYGANHDTFIALGFKQVIVQPRPDNRFYVVSGPNNDGSWNSTPRDLNDLQNNFQVQQLQTANTMLQQTDFVFIRYAEEGAGRVTIPPDLVGLRDETRAVCNYNVTTIEATESVEQLQALIDAPEEVPVPPNETEGAATMEERGTMDNPEPHLKSYPTIDVSKFTTLRTI